MRKPAAVLFVLSLAVLALALVPAAGLAAKGGNTVTGGKPSGGGSSSSSLTLRMVDDLNGNRSPNWGDTITFDVSTTATSSSDVRLTCYQNGVLVYQTQAAYYDGNPFAWEQQMPLKSGAWTSGAANCTAVLYYMNGRKTVTLTTLPVPVDA